MDEDPGVFGNLPRSRPGTRSAKRDIPAGPEQASARAAESSDRRHAKAARSSKQAATAPKQPVRGRSRPRTSAPGTSGTPRPGAAPAGGGGGSIVEVVRGGARVAGAGAKLAGGLTRGLLRRLPKP